MSFWDHTARVAGGGSRHLARDRLRDERSECGSGRHNCGDGSPAADKVPALTLAQFGAHAQIYQAVSAQAAAVHEMFVSTSGTSAGSYAATRAANAITAG
jgi:hypothetical protein